MGKIEIHDAFLDIGKKYLFFSAFCLAFLCGAVAAFSILIALVLLLFLFAGIVLAIRVYLPKLAKSYLIQFNKEKIIIKKGVFTVRENVIRLENIQYTETITALFEKRKKVCHVVLHMAGFRVIVPCVGEADAELITEKIYVKQTDKNKSVYDL